nr:glycosyltransferase [Pedobacter sp. SYSU D00873]
MVVSLQASNGTERATINLANALITYTDFQITIISIRPQKRKPLFAVDNRIEQESLNIDIKNPSEVFRYYGQLKKTLEEISPDFIISCNFYISFTLAPLSKAYNIIAWEHVLYSFPSKAFQLVRKYLYRSLSGVVCQTEYDVKQYLEDKIHATCIPNVVAMRQGFGKQEMGVKQIICVTRFSAEKGIDLLMEIIIESHHLLKDSKSRFLIIGEGDQKAEFLIKMKDYIDQGFVIVKGKTDAIEQEYANSDILILTSRSESFGLVIVEGFDYKLPAIAFAIEGGPQRLITNDHNGYLIPPFNVKEFATRLSTLALNDQQRLRIANNTPTTSAEFKESKICALWINYLHSTSNAK